MKIAVVGETIVGIDLGTTNSGIAIVEHGQPKMIPVRGELTIPSIVAIAASGKKLIGTKAKRQAITNPEHTAYAMKRLIGRNFSSGPVALQAAGVGVEMVEGPQHDVRVELRGQQYSLPEIAAMILQELKQAAEEHLGHPVHRAVITVPAYFNDGQRQATRDAGQIAGLEVVRILNEPTAAAMAYGFGKKLDRTIAVYDLGGGTFDVSIVKIGAAGTFEVLATGGDTYLGGEDFDARIMAWLADDFLAEHGLDLRADRVAMQRLKDAAEHVKAALSAMDKADVDLPFIATKGKEGLHLNRTLTRSELERRTEDLIERTIVAFRTVLAEARITAARLDDVLLVGGMTRMPKVQAAVRGLTGREPCKGVHADEAVALGAAIHANTIAGGAKPMKLLDVTPRSLGIMMAGRKFEAIIPRNTAVPTTAQRVFSTSRDGQTRVKIIVLQGEDPDADKDVLLGEFVLEPLRAAPAGEVEVEVSFAIDEDGIMTASARDVATGLAQSITVTPSGGLTRDEVTRMAERAQNPETGHRG